MGSDAVMLPGARSPGPGAPVRGPQGVGPLQPLPAWFRLPGHVSQISAMAQSISWYAFPVPLQL